MDTSTVEVGMPEEVPKIRERDKEFWFENGNIILITGGVEFHVFKGILVDHSPVFKDMFFLLQLDSTHSAHSE